MRQLTPPSRRRFGQGLGASLALIAVPRAVAAQDGPRIVTVRMSRFAFVPEILEVQPGDTVVWVNEDLAPHTATANDGSWETDPLETDASAGIVFGAPGAFDYFCAFHPHMKGTVMVLGGSG